MWSTSDLHLSVARLRPLTQTLHSAVKNGTVTLAFLDTRLDVFTLGVGPKHS